MTVDDKLLEPDEMGLSQVDSSWTEPELLDQEGVFFLKNIAEILNLDSTKVKRTHRGIIEEGRDPYQVMGVKKIWNHWLVRMKVFGPYYREHIKSKFGLIPPDMDDPNEMLALPGVYALSKVTRLLPFTDAQLRYQAQKHPNPRETMGIWRDEESLTYLVDMPFFARWLKAFWKENQVNTDSPSTEETST